MLGPTFPVPILESPTRVQNLTPDNIGWSLSEVSVRGRWTFAVHARSSCLSITHTQPASTPCSRPNQSSSSTAHLANPTQRGPRTEAYAVPRSLRGKTSKQAGRAYLRRQVTSPSVIEKVRHEAWRRPSPPWELLELLRLELHQESRRRGQRAVCVYERGVFICASHPLSSENLSTQHLPHPRGAWMELHAQSVSRLTRSSPSKNIIKHTLLINGPCRLSPTCAGSILLYRGHVSRRVTGSHRERTPSDPTALEYDGS